MWVDEFPSPNLLPPICAGRAARPCGLPICLRLRYIPSNTAHIMPWEALEAMFSGIGQLAVIGWSVLSVCGLMKYVGVLEAQSNVAFDTMLRQQNPLSGHKRVWGY